MSLVADRILDLAVERVVADCQEALQAGKQPFDGLHPMTCIAKQNRATLESACVSAQLVLDADPATSVRRKFRDDMRSDRAPDLLGGKPTRHDPGTKAP